MVTAFYWPEVRAILYFPSPNEGRPHCLHATSSRGKFARQMMPSSVGQSNGWHSHQVVFLLANLLFHICLFWNFRLIWKIPCLKQGLYSSTSLPNKFIKSPSWIYFCFYFQVNQELLRLKYCSEVLHQTHVLGLLENNINLRVWFKKKVVFFFKILFIYSWETQRERQLEAEGEAGSLQGARSGTLSLGHWDPPLSWRQMLNCGATQASRSSGCWV